MFDAEYSDIIVIGTNIIRAAVVTVLLVAPTFLS
jgi:hypothetical protein